MVKIQQKFDPRGLLSCDRLWIFQRGAFKPIAGQDRLSNLLNG
jgi:hypothetical protein